MEKRVPALQMRNITKRFGEKVIANNDVSLDVFSGEILALLGENGSGKTTLMNMLSGVYYPDQGQIFMHGKEVCIRSPKDALNLGIGMVHQHFKLVDVLTAAENITLGLKEKGGSNIKKAAEKIVEIGARYGFAVDPYQKVYEMNVSQKQTVEILKVLYRGVDYLILDEPTAVLTPQESENLFAVLRNMKADGKSIILITHKMQEVLDVSDRVVILRKGGYICDYETKNASVRELTDAMVGHKVSLHISHPEPVDPKDRIRVEHLTVKRADGVVQLHDISFTARSGEILGIAGISGSGQKELLESIAGLQSVTEGSIRYVHDDGSEEELIGKDPLKISRMGVALSFVPEDRLGMGLVGSMSLSENMMLRTFRNGKGLFVDRKSPRDLAEHVVEELDVKTPSLETPVKKLSGGNVQKILVGREIALAPTVLLAAYAVRGLDVNSSYVIYEQINRQKEAGVAVVYVGEDLDVLLELSDRLLVLCGGQVSGILDTRKATKNQVGLMMSKPGGETDE